MAISGDLRVTSSLPLYRSHTLLPTSYFLPQKVDFHCFLNGGSSRSEFTPKHSTMATVRSNVCGYYKPVFAVLGGSKFSSKSVSQEAEDFLHDAVVNMSYYERLNVVWKVVLPSAVSKRSSNARIAKQRLKMILYSNRCEVSFGLSNHPAQAQVSFQGGQSNTNIYNQAEHSLSVSTSTAHTPFVEQRLQPSSVNVDKPVDDGYNWRKYGQKQVKGREFPRSYYKCTHPNCPVKKKVERSLEGHVTAIIFKGEHNHQPPNPNKRSKDANDNSNMQGNGNSSFQRTNTNSMAAMDLESSHATGEHLYGTSDSEEVGDRETEVEEKSVEPDSKRRNTEVAVSDPIVSSHRTVTEPRIIVQTTSEVDLLDDGYRWLKYGQKVVKGNPYPRSYYKCTTAGCNVRKHVERASTDPKAVITTYKGKHNHDVPAAKTSSHTFANKNASQIKSQNTISDQPSFGNIGSVGGNEQQPVARLRLKEERIT